MVILWISGFLRTNKVSDYMIAVVGENVMAEYNMTYEEIQEFVDDCIKKSQNAYNLNLHRSEILAAITARDENDRENYTSIKESIELWENQVGAPSELLLGTRYIVIKDSVITFIQAALTSGLIDAIIANPQNPMSGITVGVASGVVFALIEIFKSVSELEDFDFCVYMQAVTHYRAHREFTQDDLEQWFPHGSDTSCNMHNSKWDCEYLMPGDSCSMLQQNHLKEALDSLCGKCLLTPKRKKAKRTYAFKM